MGRCTVTRWAFVAGLLCYCGCTGPQTFSPFGWMHSSGASQASSKTDTSNPLKPADQVAADDASSAAKAEGSKSADDAATDGKSADTPGNNGFKAATFDPELRKMIDQELAYESSQERQRLLNQWSKFDPAFVRELVENHRMARETAENRQHPVKLASADIPQDREGQAPELDLQPAAKSPDHTTRASDPIPSKQAPPATAAAVSPWSESSDMPPLPTNSSAATTPATPAIGAAGAGPAGFGSGASATTGSGPSAAADAFDSPAEPQPPARPISIIPLASAGAARNNAPKSEPSAPASQVTTSPKSDAFAGMTPLDNGMAATPAAVASAATSTPAPPAVAPAAISALPTGPVANPAQTSAGGPLIQPGVAAPASVISSLQAQAKQTGAGSGAPDLDVVPIAPSLDAPSAVHPAGSSANLGNGSDSVQPVQLQPPTELPSPSAAAPTSGTKPTPAANAPAAATSGSPGNQTSGLAGLGNRIFGAISPSVGAAARSAVQSGNWQDELHKIVAVASSEAGQTSVGTTDAEKLKYVEKQVHLRMLYLLSGQPAKSLEPISGLDAPDQEFWQQVFWGLSNYFDKTAMADPSDRATQTIAQLRTAVQRLKEKSKLELRNVAFCQKISSYGNYERVKRDEFSAGQSVLLYAEVENFKSEPTAEGPYRTILKSTIEIFDSHGQLVQRMPFQAPDDLCANPRRDYYNTYEFAIPQRIGLGPHTLKLTVEDQISHKVATYTANFTIK